MAETLPHTPTTAPRPLEHAPDGQGRVHFDIRPDIPLSGQVRALAAGHNGLGGLRVENSHLRIDVIDETIKSGFVVDQIEQPVGLPRYIREKDGSGSYRRPTIKTFEKVRFGGLIPPVIENRLPMIQLPGNTTETPMVTLAVYEASTGDLVEVREQKRDEFYSTVDHFDASDTKASWPVSESLTGSKPKDLALELTGHDNEGEPLRAFDEITRQLEDKGITSWKGLTWQRGNITQEIVFNDAKKVPTAFGDGYVWVRTFALKTTRSDGKSLGLERMNSYQLADWLEKANNGRGAIRNMHMKTPPETMADRERATYQRLGWLALPEEMNQAYARGKQLEAVIKAQTDDGPESLLDEEDRVAFWMLDYADVLDDNKRLDKIVEMTDSAEATRRVKALKQAIKQHGLLNVYDASIRLKKPYLESMKRLDMFVGDKDRSHSRVAEILADTLSQYPHILYDRNKLQTIQGALIDKLVGKAAAKVVTKADGAQAYSSALIRKRRTLVQTDKLNGDGQPKYEAQEQLEFHQEYFAEKDSPAISKPQIKAWHQREVFRIPIRNMADSIYQQLRRDITPSDEEYEQFGRLLRRSVGL